MARQIVVSLRCSNMIFLGLFFVSLATVSAQQRPIDPRLERSTMKPDWKLNRPMKLTGKTDTLIENKNVNIIVNVDPKDVAKELWSLIQTRLDGRQGRRSLPTQHTIDELERIVKPMIEPTRRSHRPTPFEVAYALDHVTRKALLNDRVKGSTIDDEIDTREIVARMMFKLKLITEEHDKRENERMQNFRRSSTNFFKKFPNSYENVNDDDGNGDDDENDDEYVRVVLKIRKSAILRGNVIYSFDDS